MAKKRLNAETIKTESLKPLLAAAGATELAVVHAVTFAGDRQAKAAARLADVQAQLEPKALQKQAEARVAELSKEAKDLQARFETLVADVRKDAAAYPATVRTQVETALVESIKTYGELVDRGEKLYEAFRKDGVKAAAALRKVTADTAETLSDLQVDSTVARRERAVVAADKRPEASKKAAARKGGQAAAKKTATKKSTAKKAPAKKAAAKKAAPAKKAAAKKAPAQKTAAASN